jgi:hypothetical protein
LDDVEHHRWAQCTVFAFDQKVNSGNRSNDEIADSATDNANGCAAASTWCQIVRIRQNGDAHRFRVLNDMY